MEGAVRDLDAQPLTGLRLRSDADARLAASIPEPGIRAFLLQSLDLTGEERDALVAFLMIL